MDSLRETVAVLFVTTNENPGRSSGYVKRHSYIFTKLHVKSIQIIYIALVVTENVLRPHPSDATIATHSS